MSHATGWLPLDAIADGVVIITADHTIADVNERFCALVGRSRAELIGARPPFPHWSPDAVEANEDAWRRVLTGVSNEVDARFCHAKGAEIDVLISARALPAGVGGGAFVAIVKDVTERRRAERIERALRRVATAAAGPAAPDRIFELVAAESRRVLRADSAAVIRFESRDEGVVLGCAGIDVPVPWTFPLEGSNTTAQTSRTGAPARVDDFAELEEPVARRLVEGGQRTGIAVPVRAHDALWGALTIGGAVPAAFPPDAEDALARMADLLATALAAADARARLEERASSDPLTGLLNHRAFQERLVEEVRRARRHDRPLSLALFDVDDFKPVNETRGHAAGDELLRVVASALRATGRMSEVIARLGGDEFAVLAPETTAMGAFALAERVRARAAAESARLGMPVTLSAGVCSLAEVPPAGDLVRLADGALYWAKAHGRDRCVRYAADVVEELSAEERAKRLEHERALAGLRALARAVDAKDPSTFRHSERVAHLAEALAGALDWPEHRVRRLREAALLHDVGKLGVPDAVLAKRGPLDERELAQVREHPALGAQIAAGILDDEQVAWIRGHHERTDGAGYPDGLAGAEIPDGARVLGVADAYDAMITSRPYRAPRTPESALAESVRVAGSQLAPEVVAVLATAVAETVEPSLGGGRERSLR